MTTTTTMSGVAVAARAVVGSDASDATTPAPRVSGAVFGPRGVLLYYYSLFVLLFIYLIYLTYLCYYYFCLVFLQILVHR